MYTEQDRVEIRQRIKKYSLILAAMLVVLIAGYVASMIVRTQVGAMVTGVLIWAVILFMWTLFLHPCIRYRAFLRDMELGMSREVRGSVVEVSSQEDLQDGVRVLPVRIQLADEDDERIVYLNVSKAEGFPAAGTDVKLSCYGRHIKEVAAL